MWHYSLCNSNNCLQKTNLNSNCPWCLNPRWHCRATGSTEEARITVTGSLVSACLRKWTTVCVFVCVCVCVSQGQVMTNDGKLEWRLPAAHSPCQQRIRGKETAEKMAVKNTHTQKTHTNTDWQRHRGQVFTKASELHRVRWEITVEQFKRDTFLRVFISTFPFRGIDWF